MGLFDKLFGKKKEESLPQTEMPQKPQENNQSKPGDSLSGFKEINGMWYCVDPVQAKKEADERRKEYLAKVHEAVRKVPGAEQYVLEFQQKEIHADFMTLTQFDASAKDRFVVFDLETTGLKYQEESIVEIGAVRVENGKITAEYSQLVNPGYSMPEDASAVNHITDEMLKGQPQIYEVLPSFLVFVGDDTLAAHNMKFDYQFLANACMINQFKIPEKLFDTMTLAKYYPEAGSKKLVALVKAAGIEVETAHRALSDARMTAKLILTTMDKRKKRKG